MNPLERAADTRPRPLEVIEPVDFAACVLDGAPERTPRLLPFTRQPL